MIVILRDDHVARIANDIDDARIARIEALMALDDARPRHAVEVSLRGASRIGNQSIDVGPGRGLIRESQIGEKKASPGVAGFRKRNQKNVVRKNEQAAAGHVQPESTLDSSNQMLGQRGIYFDLVPA